MKICETDRLIFKSGKQKVFIEYVKSQTGLSWKELSSKISKSEITLRHELRNEKYNISYSDFIKLCDICKCPKKLYMRYVLKVEAKNWGQKKGGRIGGLSKKHNMPRIIINKPEYSEKLAEFVGIMLGDGSMSKSGYDVIITLNKNTEEYYVIYVHNLMKQLFNLNLKVERPTNKNVIRIRAQSMELYNILIGLGIPSGKVEKFLPDWIMKNKSFLLTALRGLFDSDGSVYMSSKNCIAQFTITHNRMREQVFNTLKNLEIPCFIASGGKINLTSLWKIKKLYSLIGSSNLKNMIKFEEYLRNKTTIKSKDLKIYIERYKNTKLPYYYNGSVV